MANGYVLNQRPSTYGAAISLLPGMLAAAGWTYVQSGDGTSTFGSGNVFTGTGSGALGWGNSGAWARMQDPGATRELVFQHDNAAGARIKYSASAKFTGGSPGNARTPSATDEVYLWGGGTDASPTYGTWFSSNLLTAHIGGGGGIVNFLGMASDTAPYGFWFYSHLIGSTNNATSFNGGYSTLLMDPVTSVAEDPDPVVFHVAGPSGATGYGFLIAFNRDASGTTTYTDASGGTNYGSYGYMDAAKTRFLSVLPSMYVGGATGQSADGSGSNVFFPTSSTAGGWLQPSSFSGKQELLPFFWFRLQGGSTELPGIKGWSTMCRWNALMNTYHDTTDSKDWIAIGPLWLPWDGTTQPLQ